VKIKVTIQKDSGAAKTLKEFIADKEAFRKAVEAGKFHDEKKPTAPIQNPALQQ